MWSDSADTALYESLSLFIRDARIFDTLSHSAIPVNVVINGVRTEPANPVTHTVLYASPPVTYISIRLISISIGKTYADGTCFSVWKTV